MPKKIQKPFCTVFKRSDLEKKSYDMLSEFEEQKREVAELKRKLEYLISSEEKDSEE